MSPALDTLAQLGAGVVLALAVRAVWRALGSPRVNLGRFARRKR